MLSNEQLMIANFYEFPIGNVKKLVFNFFNNDGYEFYYKFFPHYLRVALKYKKTHRLR